MARILVRNAKRSRRSALARDGPRSRTRASLVRMPRRIRIEREHDLSIPKSPRTAAAKHPRPARGLPHEALTGSPLLARHRGDRPAVLRERPCDGCGNPCREGRFSPVHHSCKETRSQTLTASRRALDRNAQRHPCPKPLETRSPAFVHAVASASSGARAWIESAWISPFISSAIIA